MSNKTSKLPSATALLGDAWKIYKSRSGTFIGILALPLIVYLPFFLLVGGGAYSRSAIYFILAIPVFIIMAAMQWWAQPALLFAIWHTGEAIGFRESYRRGWRKLHSFVWVSVLSTLLSVFGIIFLFIPAIIFYVWFNLGVFILVAEDIKGANALIKSREYVKGHWWAVCGRLLFMVVVWILLFALFGMLGIFLSRLKVRFVENIFAMIPFILIMPLFTTYNFLLYEHLKELKGEFHFTPPKGFSWLRVLIFSPIVLIAVSLILIPVILLSRV